MSACKNVATIKELWQQRINLSATAPFVIENDKKYSYIEIDYLANQKLHLLRDNGIKAGDLVALQFELDIENIAIIIACLKLGVVINPLNPHFDIDEVKNLVNRFKPSAIIAQKSVRGRDTITNLAVIPNYHSEIAGDLKIFVRDYHANAYFADEIGQDAAVIVLNTSGTSGIPKGVVLTNKNVLSAEYGYNQAFGIKDDDRILMPSGLYHAIGFHHGLISTIIAGTSMVIMKHYNLDKMAEIIAKESITYIDSLPTIMYDILFKVNNLGHLRQLICGGDKISKDLLSKAKKRKIDLYNCYGLTEAVPFSYTPMNYFIEQNKMTTAVKPVKNVKIRIIKKRKIINEKAIQGMIEVSGPIIFREYLADSEKTKESFDNNWFITGDIGHYNKDGYLEIDGRNSDKIIRGGENISAHMVEDKLRKCQNIKEVAVLGVPDVRLGQRIGAFIVLIKKEQSLNKIDLLKQLRTNSVDKKFWPEKLWVVNSLPKTADGKIKKYILRNWLKGKEIDEK